jgi:hypothetical protein
MRGLGFMFVIACAVGVAASSSRGDGSPPSTTGPEPTSGEPVVPNSGDETVLQRFQPYDIGPADEAAWPYESLAAAEKDVVDAGRNVAHWGAIHDGYKQAVLLRAAEANAQAAATQLGLDNLGFGALP